MHAIHESSGVRLPRARGLGAITATVLLVATCTASATPPPPTPAASPSTLVSPPVTASPAPSLPATASPPSGTPTAEPPATPSPVPTATPRPVAAHWTAAGTLTGFAPDGLVAVSLGDGRVLLLGRGADSDAPMAVVWDRRTGDTHATASLGKPRSEFVAMPLGGSRVLVAGGTNDAYQSYSSAYVFDAAGSGSWQKVGLMTGARSAPCAAVLADGRVLVAGGYFHVKPDWGMTAPDAVLAVARTGGDPTGGAAPLDDVEPPYAGAAMATAELFDPETGSWSRTGPMRYARAGCTAATLADGRVLVFGSSDPGGITVDDHAYTTAELYDPATGRFSLAGTLPRVDRAAYPLLYEAQPYERVGQIGGLVALADGGAVLIGHRVWWKHEGEMTRTFRFDAAARSWRQVGKVYAMFGDPTSAPSVKTPGVRDVAGSAVAILPDGRVLVAGGRSAIDTSGDGWTHISAIVEAWDPATGKWSRLPSMTKAREAGVAVVLPDGSVLVAGGIGETAAGDWLPVTSMTRFVPAR